MPPRKLIVLTIVAQLPGFVKCPPAARDFRKKIRLNGVFLLFYFDECGKMGEEKREDGVFSVEKERGNFKGRVFGFDRRDVIGYIETLAGERNRLAQENQTLRGKLEALEERLAQQEAAQEEPSAQEQMDEAMNKALETLDTLRADFDGLLGDVRINVSQSKDELRGVCEKLDKLTETLKAAGERLGALRNGLGERE